MRVRADIFRRSGPESRATCADHLPPSHLQAMAAIAQCRTAALGGQVSQGTACGALAYSEHSCTHRHGPTCQNDEATRWLEQQRLLRLPVPYLLVTLTRPEARRPVARAHQSLLSHLLLQPSSAALQALVLDPQYLGGQIGLGGGRHTWSRDLASHPPSHSLGPGGALAPDGSPGLSPHSAAWLVPVHALSTLFRGTCKAALTPAGLLPHVPPQLWTQGWMTHGQPAGTGTAILASCAPSLRRLAITHKRLETCEDGHVTFRVKERPSRAWPPRTLPAEEFIRRFLQHVLPKGCLQVRSYGLLSLSRRPALAQRRALLTACLSPTQAVERGDHRAPYETPPTPTVALHGPTCGGPLVCLCRLLPNRRRPPSCESDVTLLTCVRLLGEAARQGTRDKAGAA